MTENKQDKINSLTERWVMECYQQGELILRTIKCYSDNHSPDLKRYNLFRRRLIVDVKKALLSSEITSDLFDIELELLWDSSEEHYIELRQSIIWAYARLDNVGLESPSNFKNYKKNQAEFIEMLSVAEAQPKPSRGAPHRPDSINEYLGHADCQKLIDEIILAHRDLKNWVSHPANKSMTESQRKKALLKENNVLGNNYDYVNDHLKKNGEFWHRPKWDFIYKKIYDAMTASNDWQSPDQVDSVKTARQKQDIDTLQNFINISEHRASRK